ncbi:uncharacterized protein BX663DRAFT_495759 [Cokeromyces recurvatus]|uniref:uncharacterized protein n=1 Tax=Cokeromyces recurvatus TaxID=90255 RepID=UPI00221E6806|nr:uncharacterized protein BX663DRAFT_495759 [Cokeromyces recurvatus]KAI7907394.1 hypothetical protein BX663DRAFT_495759 [Cokeromyces recurvatus]
MLTMKRKKINEVISYNNLKYSEKFSSLVKHVNVYISNPSNPTLTSHVIHKESVKKDYSSTILDIVICYDYSTIEILERLLKHSTPSIITMLLDIKYVQRSMIIDKAWCSRMWAIASKAHLLAVTGVYYSMLGGAFCSLGKSNTKYAYKAGALAIEQIKLAKKLKDPILECKCWLYFAEDLIHLKELEKAEKIINHQREFIDSIEDAILVAMLESVIRKIDIAKSK